jgi:hypothetical protein
VYCQDRPRKYSPATSVTPRRVHDTAVGGHAGNGDPRVVGPVAGRPDDDGNVEGAVVGETRGASLGVDEARPESHAGPLEPSAVCADNQLSTCSQPAAEACCGVHSHEAESGEPPEQVPAE